jgi:hypothetical protein
MIRQNKSELIMSIEDFSNLGYDFICRKLYGNKFQSVAADRFAAPMDGTDKSVDLQENQ